MSCPRIPVSCCLALMAPAALAAEYNLQPPVTPLARTEYHLHTLLLIITGVIFLLVFLVMLYSIIRHRKAAGHEAKQFHENTTVEIIWTIVPLLILVLMALPATRAVLAQKSTRSEDMTIKITGYQWKWRYDYLDDNFGFVSHLSTPREAIEGKLAKPPNYLLEVDEPLVVPTNRKIRLLLTANDVIHSWWVPQLGVKQDAIPGFLRDSWMLIEQPGTYRGQCSELCGKDHGFMPIVVEAKSPEDYAKWREAKLKQLAANADDPNKVWQLAELKARGEKVYTQNCIPCHQANGKGIPGAFPALDGSPIATGDKAAHIEIVLYGGKKNPAMAAWGKQLSDTDIAAVITYERNSWGNHTGQVVQPKEIKAARGKAA
ncbi:cytochrome c oxidase subunit II [Chromobacterium amazonense]|uniref:Cytochrome c oxidase subunit 2 n=2 Tax=Chromobacterium amazonense TaxID=1382803 RepID=A0ABU8UX59_9NEIS|nr:cytochrome c oxidase subunit II [Chromobacterium amazonense]KIA81881.1 cytochrome C oxidase subunit II [Chromobacterium piscinae]MBM2885509.1 cytochrome c oxidase subunit II [Chromobacterium amazonense]MDQ4539135.1 cytochrome c oxidase subunit II [Chromobacterium amazonense]